MIIIINIYRIAFYKYYFISQNFKKSKHVFNVTANYILDTQLFYIGYVFLCVESCCNKLKGTLQ